MAVPSCRHFSGYKPCHLNSVCDDSCPSLQRIRENILIIHLGALGAVVRSTSLLAAMKRKHPQARIFWVTEAPAAPLLENHPQIDHVLIARMESLWPLQALEFSAAYVIDKSLQAVGIMKTLKTQKIFGFTADPLSGAILPATPAAERLWRLGLDDHEKFFVNQRPETELMIEALELGTFQRDPYHLPLQSEEILEVQQRRQQWSHDFRHLVVGLNTGCSSVIPYKKLSVEFQRRICQHLSTDPRLKVVLLGGQEDTERNTAIAQGLPVIQSSTQRGLRDGLVSVAACDVVITGDSLGMHMAISQKKWVVAWFGPTCAQEIDLYGRGVKLQSQAACSPCWKRSCQKPLMCYDQVDLRDILNGVEKGIEFWQRTLSSIQPSWAMFS